LGEPVELAAAVTTAISAVGLDRVAREGW